MRLRCTPPPAQSLPTNVGHPQTNTTWRSATQNVLGSQPSLGATTGDDDGNSDSDVLDGARADDDDDDDDDDKGH